MCAMSSCAPPERIVFFHHPCLDGSVAAWLYKMSFGTRAHYIGVGHGDYQALFEHLTAWPAIKNLVFLDYALPEKETRMLLTDGYDLSIYDHHATAVETLGALAHKNMKCFFDVKKSGAGIVWDTFFAGHERPSLINAVESVDLGNYASFVSQDEFYKTAAFLDSLDLSCFEKTCSKLDELRNWSVARLVDAGSVVREEFLEKIERVLSGERRYTNFPVDGGLSRFPFIHADIYVHSRELFPHLLKRLNTDVAIVWHQEAEGQIRLHVQSCNDVSAKKLVERIVMECGGYGGGHEYSAVARLNPLQFDKFRKNFCEEQ